MGRRSETELKQLLIDKHPEFTMDSGRDVNKLDYKDALEYVKELKGD